MLEFDPVLKKFEEVTVDDRPSDENISRNIECPLYLCCAPLTSSEILTGEMLCRAPRLKKVM